MLIYQGEPCCEQSSSKILKSLQTSMHFLNSATFSSMADYYCIYVLLIFNSICDVYLCFNVLMSTLTPKSEVSLHGFRKLVQTEEARKSCSTLQHVFQGHSAPIFSLLRFIIQKKASLANIKHKPTAGVQNWHYINCQHQVEKTELF